MQEPRSAPPEAMRSVCAVEAQTILMQLNKISLALSLSRQMCVYIQRIPQYEKPLLLGYS